MAENLYISLLKVNNVDYLLKDAEARASIEEIKNIKGVNYVGRTDGNAYQKESEAADYSVISDLLTLQDTTTGTSGAHVKIDSVKYYVAEGTGHDKVLKNGDLITVKRTISGVERELEYVVTIETSGSNVIATFHEFGSTGALGSLAFKSQATVSGNAASHTHTYSKAAIDLNLLLTQGTVSSTGSFTPSGSNAPSLVTFTSGAGSNFVTGYNNDAVAPTFTEGTFSPGTLPSFTEGAFTPASLGSGFVTAGTAATYSHSGFSGGSLGNATKSTFAKEGVVASVDTATETLTLTSATTSNAVTEQGAFTAAVYGTDTFNGGTPTAIDVTKFNGGSKAADTFSKGTLPSKAADTFNAGSAATLATAKALTASVTGTAAAQTFTGTAGAVNVSGTSNTTISKNITLKYTTENSGSIGAAVTGTAV